MNQQLVFLIYSACSHSCAGRNPSPRGLLDSRIRGNDRLGSCPFRETLKDCYCGVLGTECVLCGDTFYIRTLCQAIPVLPASQGLKRVLHDLVLAKLLNVLSAETQVTQNLV